MNYKAIIPPFPKRWSMPIKEIRSHLKGVLIEDLNDDNNIIKRRKLKPKEISDLIDHWRDMVKYSKQHFKDAFDPDIMRWRPFLRFVAVEDSRTCYFCHSFHGKIVLSSNPRASQYFPPLHIGCGCTMVTLSERELKRDGFIESWPDIDINLPDLFQISVHVL